MSIVRDKAEPAWLKWHNGVKKKLKELISGNVKAEEPYDLGERMDWGRLDKYKPDITWRKNDKLSFFEVECYYNQDKIVRDIVYARFLNADQLVFIFSNQETEWGRGEKRAKATCCLAEKLSEYMSKPLRVKAIFIGEPEELEKKLKEEKIL